jgi:hypothetical protein
MPPNCRIESGIVSFEGFPQSSTDFVAVAEALRNIRKTDWVSDAGL